MRFCDYCGTEIAANTEWEAVAFGHSQGHLRGCTADEWFYYCDGDCLEAVRRTLKEMAEWANRREGAGLTWRLEAMPGATEAPPKAEPAPGLHVGDLHIPAPEGLSPPPVSGELGIGDHVTHPPTAQALRAGGVRTLEEAAKRTEFEVRTLEGVGEVAMCQIRRGMAAHGLAFREGPDGSDLGMRIRAAREAAGLSRRQLANAIDPRKPERDMRPRAVYESNISTWERGVKAPSSEWLDKLAQFFKVPVAHFLETEGTA